MYCTQTFLFKMKEAKIKKKNNKTKPKRAKEISSTKDRIVINIKKTRELKLHMALLGLRAHIHDTHCTHKCKSVTRSCQTE